MGRFLEDSFRAVDKPLPMKHLDSLPISDFFKEVTYATEPALAGECYFQYKMDRRHTRDDLRTNLLTVKHLIANFAL